MNRPLLVVALIVGVLGGCGGTSSGIGDTASRSLEPRIAEVRAAAEAGQADAVRAKLAEIRAEVATLRERGNLSEAGAARVLGAVAGVEAQLPLITKTTTPPRPSTTLPRTTATTQPDRKAQEEEKKKLEEEQKKREEEQKKRAEEQKKD